MNHEVMVKCVNGDECMHVIFVLSQPDVIRVLREKGWRGPDYL
ncbi:MAG: hypothetical protein QXU87_03265 [Candidatus Caldarchaeum sp.]